MKMKPRVLVALGVLGVVAVLAALFVIYKPFAVSIPGVTGLTPENSAVALQAAASAANGSFEDTFIRQPGVAEIVRFDGAEAARGITASGASNKNAERNDGGYTIETQRVAYAIISAGVLDNDPVLLDKGLKALEWGFAQQAADGSFPGERLGEKKPVKYLHIHPISFFVESAAHSVLLLRASNVDKQYKDRAAALIPKIYLAGKWMNNPSNLDNFFTNAVDTNMLTTAALAIHEAGMLGNDAALRATAKDLVKRILARQHEDGTFPEKKGFDSSYQMVSLEYLTRYASLLSDRAWRQEVMLAVDKGFEKERTYTNSKGVISDRDNTRTEVCVTIPGNGPKGKDIDIIPYRLYYYGYLAGKESEYSVMAARVLKAGQGFDHKGDCNVSKEKKEDLL